MPPPRRGSRRRTAASAAARSSRRLSVRHGEPFKRESRGDASPAAAGDGDGDDDGLPLDDECLLLVFSAAATTADLVRCAATCRRWRRLVSADAAFLCRRRRAPLVTDDPLIRTLALGFFFHSRTGAAPPRFVPLSAAGTRLQPSFAGILNGGGASRVVASSGGRLVLDLRRRRGSSSRTTTGVVRLGVCNPVTAGGGGVDVLPPLRGKDSPAGPYACTVITAADDDDRRQQHGSYRVILLYNRRSFTAVRCYSSRAGSWGPEAVVTGARVGRSHHAGGPHAAVVCDGVVFWPRLAMALHLDSLLQPPPPPAARKKGKTPAAPYTVAGFSSQKVKVDRLVGVMPDGRMLRVEADSETIRAYWGGDGGGGGGLKGERLEWKWTMKQALMRVHTVRLRWLFEKSGIVIFTARNGHDPDTDHGYTVDVETRRFTRVATAAASGEPALVGEICGYEMDRMTLLASLGR
ncbi:unnamed protein product [Urochloa humidicola]